MEKDTKKQKQECCEGLKQLETRYAEGQTDIEFINQHFSAPIKAYLPLLYCAAD